MARGSRQTRPKGARVSYQTIDVRYDEAVAHVTLNRPDVLNALNLSMLGELRSALAGIETDRSLRVVILTGAGERAFAAGADIAELASLEGAVDGTEQARAGQALTAQIEALRVPVIAAINGFALGGGCELAMACDIRIAADRAKFGQPEVNLGLMPGYGGTQRTARLLGRGMASLLCLSAETIDAAEAHRIGLVEKVVPASELGAEALRVARAIASKAPLAVAATKRAIRDGGDVALKAGLEIEALHFGGLVGTADFAEGTAAFLAKRRAAFAGR